MTDPRIAEKAPFVLDMKPGNYYWCACGKSNKQPFCDGSHKGSEFSPVKTEINEEKQVAWCACKHSTSAPFCDGTHRKL